MGQFTLRGLDPEIEREIRNIAKQTGKSINRVILDMISQCSGTGKKRRRPLADSLKELAGGWSKREARTFLSSIECFERIDEEMWK